MSMIITSVFLLSLFHRDLTFGFISTSDRVHGQSSSMSTSKINGNGLRLGHRLGHRQNHESEFMTSNSWSKRCLSKNLGLWQTSDTLVRPFLADIYPRILFGPLSEPSTISWGGTVRPTFLYASRKNNGALHVPQCMGNGIDDNQF